jgi:hypothetical protein
MVTIETQLPLIGAYSLYHDLRNLLYSRKSDALGVDDECFRDFMRDFVIGFGLLGTKITVSLSLNMASLPKTHMTAGHSGRKSQHALCVQVHIY